MTTHAALALDATLARLRQRGLPGADAPAIAARIGGLRLVARSDDAAFIPRFFAMFGGSALAPGAALPEADLGIELAAGDEEHGWFRLGGRSELPVDAHEFSFSLADQGGLFETLDAGPDWHCLAFRGTRVPALAFHGRDAVFARSEQWRDSVLWYLFWRVLRMRDDAIFFHASSLGIGALGTMFVGPAGAGKSTTALALAARGHNFLGDEVAAYLPRTGELFPFRRPVGIKPGPRAKAVQQGLRAEDAERIDRDGFLRVGIETLMPVDDGEAVPLRRVVFLRGFRERPHLRRVPATRGHVAELQPLMSSFLNAPHARRVFELTRLLGNARIYELHPGEPDATAHYLEEAFASE